MFQHKKKKKFCWEI